MADNNENKVLNVPHLRFPEFSGEWDSERLENLTVSIGDGLHSTPVYCEQGDYCFINGNNIIDGKVSINEKTLRVTKEEAYKYNAALLKVDTILMSINGTIGNVALYNGENIMLGKSACYINPSSRIVREYLFHILSSPRIQAYFQGEVTGTTIKNLSLRTIRGSKILLPSNEEQKKIARLFSLVDERIATQNKIIEDLKKLKSAIVDKLYSSTNGKTYSFCQLFEVVNEKNKKLAYKNVLSASQELGMIERSNINIDIKFEQESISGYKIVRKGDYVVHLRSFQGGFAFSDTTGICSPAYTILRPNDLVVYGYLSHFFTSKPFIKSLKLVTYGIRDGRSINVDEWLDMPILLPSAQEQMRILTIVNAIDAKLHNEAKVQFCLSSQKSYLLNTMFI